MALLPYYHNTILPYCHTAIFLYSHNVVLLHCHTVILPYCLVSPDITLEWVAPWWPSTGRPATSWGSGSSIWLYCEDCSIVAPPAGAILLSLLFMYLNNSVLFWVAPSVTVIGDHRGLIGDHSGLIGDHSELIGDHSGCGPDLHRWPWWLGYWRSSATPPSATRVVLI